MELNPLQQAIKDKIVEPALRDRQHMVRATIIKYDNKSNRASVEFSNPSGPGKKRLNGVSLSLAGGGVHSAGPFAGDQVWVTFLQGSMLNARIVALADEDYEHNSREQRLNHKRAGTLLPDGLSAR